jgi:phosphoribosylaminoimidazolecarboxamide formyltransferase/IMP cyclohydrolase
MSGGAGIRRRGPGIFSPQKKSARAHGQAGAKAECAADEIRIRRAFSATAGQFFKTALSATVAEDILFGERVAAYLKSNAIAIVAGGQTLGLGMGQVNRVDAVKQAIERMHENKKHFAFNIEDAVLVSDAFFPFPDSVELIAAAGIRWIAQPGGSVQDAQVRARAEELQIRMVMTKRRHFKH